MNIDKQIHATVTVSTLSLRLLHQDVSHPSLLSETTTNE